MARFRLSGHNLRVETGKQEGLPRYERPCRRCKRPLSEYFVASIDDEDLMQRKDVGSVACFVHECKGRVDNSHTG
jgi:hypothetical protein